MGVERDTFLFKLRYWEVQAHIRGYQRRSREAWAMTRWHAWWVIHNGMVDWSKEGLTCQKDMITFPWEQESISEVPQEVVDELTDLMRSINKKGEQ